MIITSKALAITRIFNNEPGSIEVHGKMLEEKVGLYALRVY